MPLRYYVYVSRSKVDQLVEQVPSKRLGKIAKKLTIDLKILKAEFGSREGPAQQSLYAKLRIVESYLNETEAVRIVDDVDADGTFFSGQLPLRWARLGRRGRSGVVYFSGRTPTTMLGMGGSARHLVGAAEEAQVVARRHSPGGTHRPDLLEAMRKHIGSHDNEVGFRVASSLPRLMHAHEMDDQPASRMTFLGISLQVEPFESNLERDAALRRRFLGTPMYERWEAELERDAGIRRALLGTPVYVAVDA